MRKERSRYELRCEFCAYSPLLAVYGMDEKGKLYIHVKVYKSGRVYAELVITDGGTVQLCCRDCYRWQRIIIRQPDRAELEVGIRPEFLEGVSRG